MFRAHEITSYEGPFNFGIDQKKAAAQLRKLADEIENALPAGREYRALSMVDIIDSVDMNDYSMTTVVLKFATIKEGLETGKIGGPRPVAEAPAHIQERIKSEQSLDTNKPAV